jgi:hypothetical protein
MSGSNNKLTLQADRGFHEPENRYQKLLLIAKRDRNEIVA